MLHTPAGREQLAVLFHFCPSEKAGDLRTLMNWAGSGVIDVPAQSNDELCREPVCNIRAICTALAARAKDSASPVEALAHVARAQQGRGQCFDITRYNVDWQIALLKNTSSPERAWPWQTCAEYGFFQTCEAGSYCPFLRGGLNVTDSYRMCKEAFGVDAATVDANVRSTNLRYGGLHPAARRILHINGDVDPWSSLGITRSPAWSQPVYLVRGASHHAWTHSEDTISQPEVRRAKRKVWLWTKLWLLDPRPTTRGGGGG